LLDRIHARECWIVLRTRSDTANEIEILSPRHQLTMLQRRTPRPPMRWTDRARHRRYGPAATSTPPP
jgi:hypothetical protein